VLEEARAALARHHTQVLLALEECVRLERCAFQAAAELLGLRLLRLSDTDAARRDPRQGGEEGIRAALR
jgi:hypothetical protein